MILREITESPYNLVIQIILPRNCYFHKNWNLKSHHDKEEGCLKICYLNTDAWIYCVALFVYLDHFWNDIHFMDGTLFNDWVTLHEYGSNVMEINFKFTNNTNNRNSMLCQNFGRIYNCTFPDSFEEIQELCHTFTICNKNFGTCITHMYRTINWREWLSVFNQ